MRYATTEANQWQRHLSHFGRADGHLAEDEWAVEKILDERGEDDEKEYLVRWVGWTSAHDAWLPVDDVSGDLVVAYHAERDRERLVAEKEERDERSSYAAEAIACLRSRLIEALLKQKKSAATSTILRLELCEEWKFKAVLEHLESLVPDGDAFADHLTAIERTAGASGRSKYIEDTFYVTSHFLTGKLFTTEEQDKLREEHVAFRVQGNGTAVALLPSIKFSRRGPRAAPHKMKLTVKAGFGTLNARPSAAPFWRFESDVCYCEPGGGECECERAHHGAIARRVAKIVERAHVNGRMVRTCRVAMQQV